MDRAGNKNALPVTALRLPAMAKAAALILGVLLLVAGEGQAAIQAEAASSNEVTLTWTAPGDDGDVGTASEYDLRYSESLITDANWDQAVQVSGLPSPQSSGSSESFIVTGLNPGTTYYFALKAADEMLNWSSLSNVVSATTDQEQIAPAQVTDLHMIDSSSGTVTIAWTAPGDDGNIGTASQYDIRYSTAPITDANWDAATQVNDEPVPMQAGSSESYTVTGLLPSTSYYFALKTADEVPNWSTLSNSAPGRTAVESAAPAAIADLAAGNETETTIRLTWTAPGDDGTSGKASEYDIRYSTSPITAANWDAATQVSGEPVPKSAGSSESFVVTGLQNTTTYYFAIRTADEVPNWSPLSNVVSQETAPDQTPPAAIDDLQALTGQNDGEIDLAWTAPGDDGMTGQAELYLIGYSTEEIDSSNWNSASLYTDPPAPSGPGAVERCVLGGLQGGTTYYVAVRTVDEAGNISPISNAQSAEAFLDIVAGVDDGDENGLPTEYTLSQNYPNPFNPSTTIEYSLPEGSYVHLQVFNVLGQSIAELVDGYQSAGSYRVTWDGRSDDGKAVATGVYMYRLAANGFAESRTMVLLK